MRAGESDARPVLRVRDVWKTFPLAGGDELHALRGVSLDVRAGRALAITGRSGSGKSTLLHISAGIEAPTRGSVEMLGRDLASMTEAQRTLERREHVGLVFQFFHLLPHLSVRDNTALPALIAGEPRSTWQPRVEELLGRVGLAERADDPVERLSGGEQQRVAICRALLRRPRLLLADEPTGNLDDETGQRVLDLLLELSREEGSGLVYVTHSLELAGRADRTANLHSGVLDAR